jgi:hypothetical protein
MRCTAPGSKNCATERAHHKHSLDRLDYRANVLEQASNCAMPPLALHFCFHEYLLDRHRAVPAVAGPDCRGTPGVFSPGASQGSSSSSRVSRRYNLSIGMSVNNRLNHTNPGPIIGNITSLLFGQANQPSGGGGGFGGGGGLGFSESANNRRLELQMRFSF